MIWSFLLIFNDEIVDFWLHEKRFFIMNWININWINRNNKTHLNSKLIFSYQIQAQSLFCKWPMIKWIGIYNIQLHSTCIRLLPSAQLALVAACMRSCTEIVSFYCWVLQTVRQLDRQRTQSSSIEEEL